VVYWALFFCIISVLPDNVHGAALYHLHLRTSSS